MCIRDRKDIVYLFEGASLGQRTRFSCWLSAFKLVYQWGSENGKNVSPDSVDRLVTEGAFGGDSDKFDEAVSTGLKKEDRAAAFASVNMATVDRDTILGWDFDALYAALESHGPLVYTKTVNAADGSFTTHAVVIYGASSITDPSTVKIVDPYNETALDRGSGPYLTHTNDFTFNVWKSTLPPKDSVSGATAIGWLK